MQNSCKASSHRPEQNSSFYFVEKAIDFPYELRLYSDSVYSWAVTGLPKAALQTSCSLTTSVVIILLSGRDNLKCPRSSEMQDRQQELLTFFFFLNVAFSMPENGTAMNLHSGLPSLDSHWKTQSIKVPSTQPLSRELCQVARDDIPDSMKTKVEPWKHRVCACPAEPQEGHPQEGLSANHHADVTSLSNSSNYSASFGLALKNKRKLISSKVTCSCYLFLFFKLTNSVLLTFITTIAYVRFPTSALAVAWWGYI